MNFSTLECRIGIQKVENLIGFMLDQIQLHQLMKQQEKWFLQGMHFVRLKKMVTKVQLVIVVDQNFGVALTLLFLNILSGVIYLEKKFLTIN